MGRDLSTDHLHGAAAISVRPSAMAAVSPGTDVAAAWLSGMSAMQNQNQGCLVQAVCCDEACPSFCWALIGFSPHVGPAA